MGIAADKAVAYSDLCTKIALCVWDRWIRGEETSGICDHLVKVEMTWIQSQPGWRGEGLTGVEEDHPWTEWHFGWPLGEGAGEKKHFCKGRRVWQTGNAQRASH